MPMRGSMMTDEALASRIDRLESCEAIRNRLHLYCRGIDRRDPEILKTVFWPDSKVEYGMYAGSGAEFAEMICGWMDDGFKLTAHMLGNVTIAVDGDIAHTEAYLHAFHHLTRDDGSIFDWTVGGRYQDRLERRNGEWRIAFRRLIFDWYRDWDDTRAWANGLRGITDETAEIGVRAPDSWLALETLRRGVPV